MILNYKLLGKRIKETRKRKGLTQEMLAEKIDISPSFMSYIENGSKHQSLYTFVLIANELNVSADELLRDSLENTVKVSNHQFSALLTDCSDYELRVLFDILKVTKTALREHQYLSQRRRRL